MKTIRISKKKIAKMKQQIFNVFAFPMYQENGAAAGTVDYLRVITESKKREKALRESEARYESILQASNTGVWEYDAANHTDRYSPSYFTYLGYEPGEFADETGIVDADFWESMLHPEDRQKAVNTFFGYLEAGSPGTYENTFRLRKKDGTWVWFLSRGKTLRDEDGNPTNLTIGTHTDVTHQKQTEIYREAGREVLNTLNQPLDFVEALQRVADDLKHRTGFDSIGIRLKEDDDYPLAAHSGLGKAFLSDENTLLTRNDEGEICRDEMGQARLACVCGMVLTGKKGLQNPGRTGRGSLWTNHFASYLKDCVDQKLCSEVKDRCLHRSYNSVALVPLRNKEEIMGLLYLADTRSGSLTREIVTLVEDVAAVLGEAVANKRIRDQLTTTEEQSGLLISQMQLGLAVHEIICDKAGEPVDYRFISVNDSYEKMTGLRRENLIGKRVLEVLPKTEDYWVQSFGEVALTGRSKQFENYSVELDKYFRVTAYAPQKKQFAVIVDDVTDKRKAALELEQAKELAETANKAKSQFLANMSHELRTPLNGLMGMIQLLQTTELTKDQEEYIQIARHSCQSLTGVVGEILNYTSLDKNRETKMQDPFDLNELLKEVTDLHRPAATHKGLSLTARKEQHVPTQLVGDRLKLKQILGNLTGNAVKFTEKGVVHLSVKSEAADDPDRVRLSFHVKDTGIGIPPEKTEYIFQHFSQADESHTRAFGGVGLGLAVSRELATVLGGELTVKSSPGQGSVFTLTCEMGVGQAERFWNNESAESGSFMTTDSVMNVRVLVVDDDFASLKMAEIQLRKMGCQVETAKNGREALNKMAAETYNLVLMDCQMPVMTGYEATRHIRNSEAQTGRHTPIVAMTAKVLPGDQEECLAAGMDGFMAKPFERERLVEVVLKFARV